MANSPSTLSNMDKVETADFVFFADLCLTTATEDNRFFVACAILGVLLSVLVRLLKNRFSGSADIHVSMSGCVLPILTIVGVSVLAFLGAELLFPDPRDNGNDCGFTPDSIFPPLWAGVVVPIAFVFAYRLMLAVLSPKRTK